MSSHLKDRSIVYSLRYYSHTTGPSYLTPGLVTQGRIQPITRQRTGSGVQNWQSLIRNHQNATSALTGIYDTIDIIGSIYDKLVYYADSIHGWGGDRNEEYVDGNVAGYDIQPYIIRDTSLDALANGKAANAYLSEARKTITNMDGGTFLGELKQTLRMLRHPAEALGRSIDNYYNALSKRKREEMRRRRRKGLPQLPKDSPKWEWYHSIPALWLEYSFGWVPLMMDIDDAFEALNSLLERDRVVHISKGGQAQKLIGQIVSSGNLYAGGIAKLRRDHSRRVTLQTTVRYRGDVTAQAATTFADKAAKWGFTPSQFLPTAWELLPWSFLVDYFATIGDYLDASFTNTASLRWTCVTTRRVYTTEHLVSPNRGATLASIPAAGRPEYASSGPSFARYKRVEVQRSVGGVPVPTVVFKSFQDQSSGHLANMSALFGAFCDNLHSQNPSPRNFRR